MQRDKKAQGSPGNGGPCAFGGRGLKCRLFAPRKATLLASIGDNFVVRNSPWWGLTRRLRRGRRACSPMGARLLQGANRRFPKGNEGKRVSSGYNRRRRLATRSSGKQQAERTAVRAAPIVCPEESPLVRPQAQTPAPVGPDAPTPARG